MELGLQFNEKDIENGLENELVIAETGHSIFGILRKSRKITFRILESKKGKNNVDIEGLFV